MSGPAESSSRTGRQHYSYSHYADTGVAEQFDALRFGGPIGTLLLETQERLLLDALAPVAGRAVLDVGTGTGRAAIALARAGARVTGVDASEAMLAVARERAAAASVAPAFQVGDAHHLPFDDRSFDAVVCLRVIMHTPDWELCVRELCRVARQRVVLDFPAAASAAALESALRRAGRAMGSRTEAYRVFRPGRIAGALGREGYRVVSIHRQFVLPIALHKRIGSRRFTQATERALAAAGLLRLVGSPVTVVAER